MEMDDYQSAALATANLLTKNASEVEVRLNLAVLGLGVTGEAGEVADYLKKVVGHGHELDKDKLKSELGDVMWYIATLSDAVGLDLSEVAEANIEKLRKRYPDGFSSERSRNRDGL